MSRGSISSCYRLCYVFLWMMHVVPVSASPWIPKTGYYKYYFTVHNADRQTKAIKTVRYKYYSDIQKIIDRLATQQLSLSPQAVKYQLIQKNIDELKQQQSLLSTYQDDSLYSGLIEYGINNNSSFGIKASYKNNIFNTTKSNARSANIFYKIQLLKHNDFILAIEPQIHTHKDNTYCQELYSEIAVLLGRSFPRSYGTLSFDASIRMGSGANRATGKKRYYSFSTSENIKLPYGIMLSSFSQYYLRKNYTATDNSTLYQQFSIAKELDLGILQKNKLTIQLGYFWNQSINYRGYKVSGTVFSMWSEI